MANRVPFFGSEADSLQAALDRHRDVLVWKLSGLSDEQVRQPVTPSAMSMLGLLKHIAWVEYGWFCDTFGRPHEEIAFDEADPDADFRIEPTESTQDILDLFARARQAATLALAEVPLDSSGTSWSGEPVSMRWVAIHMLEEDARHAGHMDVMRELLDGTTGDHDRS